MNGRNERAPGGTVLVRAAGLLLAAFTLAVIAESLNYALMLGVEAWGATKVVGLLTVLLPFAVCLVPSVVLFRRGHRTAAVVLVPFALAAGAAALVIATYLAGAAMRKSPVPDARDDGRRSEIGSYREAQQPAQTAGPHQVLPGSSV
jgi:hypothetical protein